MRLTKHVTHSDRNINVLSHKVDLLSSNLLTISMQVQAVADALKVTTQPVVVPTRGMGSHPSMSSMGGSTLGLSPPSHSPMGARASPPPRAPPPRAPSPETRQIGDASRKRSATPEAVEVVAVVAPAAAAARPAASVARNRDNAGSLAELQTPAAPLPVPLPARPSGSIPAGMPPSADQ